MRREYVNGPYRHRNKWRIIFTGKDGRKAAQSFTDKDEAEAIAAEMRKQISDDPITVLDGLAMYKAYLTDRGNKPATVKTTLHRLRDLLTDELEPLSAITQGRAESLYGSLASRRAVDTHRNTLNQCKTFFRWLVKRGIVRRSPFEGVEGVGRRKRGKKQLTIDEFRALAAHCFGSPSSETIAVISAAILGLRASELCGLLVRDLDDGGRVVIVSSSKTEAGIRRVGVPEVLRPHLLALCDGKDGPAAVFDGDRHWLLRNTKLACKAAGVPVVTPHGLRGTHSSLATEAGATSQAVAGTLGHAGTAVTERHYISGSAAASERARRVGLVLLNGGNG